MNEDPLSLQQCIAFKESDARINIWQGAVRSGKTFSSLLKFLSLLKDGPHGHAMIIGVTRDSIQRNLVTEICNLIGASVPGSKTAEMKLMGRQIYFVGANDESAVRRIQGSTLALAYVDEATCIPEPFWNMLLSRLSIKGSQLLATCNPSSPLHWLKTKYLDRDDELDLKSWKFTLDDNPSLSPEYVDSLKKEFTGMWYQRYILGEWAVAEGLVYDAFNDDNIVTHVDHNPSFKIVGIDFGMSNPTAACLIEVNPTQWPQLYVSDTFYYDGGKSLRSKTIGEIADDIQAWLLPHNISMAYLDPSALALKLELQQRKIPVKNANNDVLPGIQLVGKFFGDKTLCVHKKNKELIEELYTYSWDQKSAERGIDKPIKESDHLCFIAGTMIATSEGDKPIEEINIGDQVLTRKGFRNVKVKMASESSDIWELKAGDKTLIATGDHPIWTDKGFKSLNLLTGCNTICVLQKDDKWKKKESSSTVSHTEDIQIQKIYQIPAISGRIFQVLSKGMATYIGMYGEKITDLFQKAFKFIISMVTPPITQLKTSNALASRSITRNILLGKEDEKRCLNTWKVSESKQKYGMRAKRVGSGIENTQRTVLQRELKDPLNVSYVRQDLKHIKRASRDSVVTNANLNGEETQVWTISNENVNCVAKPLAQADIKKLKTVQKNVQQNLDGLIVYNLTVDGEHEYFANGVLTSNCDALRYGIYSRFPKGLGTENHPDQTISAIRKRAYGENNSLLDSGYQEASYF